MLLVRKWAGFLRCWIIDLCLGFPATWNNRDIFLSRRNFQIFSHFFRKKRCKKSREKKLKMRNSGLVELVKNRIHTASFIRTTQGFQNPSCYSNSTLWKRTNQLFRLTRSESNAKIKNSNWLISLLLILLSLKRKRKGGFIQNMLLKTLNINTKTILIQNF